MSHFSDRSLAKLSTCAQPLQDLFVAVVVERDCTIIEGARSEADQNLYYTTGRSKLPWPHGKHCQRPSEAVDVAPCFDGRLSWDQQPCIDFGKFVVEKAKALGIPIRWGGDWDGDGDRSDQSFNDLVHFELK